MRHAFSRAEFYKKGRSVVSSILTHRLLKQVLQQRNDWLAELEELRRNWKRGTGIGKCANRLRYESINNA